MKATYFFTFVLVPLMVGANNPQEVVEGNNRFAFKLFHELQGGKNENQFFSPFSISTAMAMVYAGAANETARQISKTMDFQPGGAFHAEFRKTLIRMDESTAGKIKLNVANGMWIQHDFQILPEYLQLVKTNYRPEVKSADFKNPPERARTRLDINGWVEQKTNEKIKNLLSKTDLDSLTRLVLVNAIYFYGDWDVPFTQESTRTDSFNPIDGPAVNVPFMNQQGRFRYFEDADIQAIELPYKENKASMVIVLPRTTGGIEAFEKSFDYAKFKGISESATVEDVRLSMPKFETTFKIELGSKLSRMGMPVAFTPDADFSGITGRKDLCISRVIHQAFIRVDEKGTEAAAATAIVMRFTTARAPGEIKHFKADHPFIFLIKDNDTGSILFMGKVMSL